MRIKYKENKINIVKIIMFATYDYSKFPEVKVVFNGNIQDENEYTLFTDQWLQLYEDKKDFTFLFDVENMGIVSPYYCYKIAAFIGEMRKREHRYLQSSTIINVNSFVYGLLKLVFMIQSPISPVTIQHIDGSISVVTP